MVGITTTRTYLEMRRVASTDDSVSVFRTYLSSHNKVFELLKSECNGAYARGNNIGLKHLESDDDITESEFFSQSYQFKEIGQFILYRKSHACGKTNFLLPGISCIHLGGQTANKVSHPAEYMRKSISGTERYVDAVLEISFAIFQAVVTAVKALESL